MDTLSQRVAEVLRRELAADRTDAAAYAQAVGMPKTTVWRKINGTSKISVDDAAALAAGLGWTLQHLLEKAAQLGAADAQAEAIMEGMSSRSRRAAQKIRDDHARANPPPRKRQSS